MNNNETIFGFGIRIPSDLISQMYYNLLIHMSSLKIQADEYNEHIIYEDNHSDFTKAIVNSFNKHILKLRKYYRINNSNNSNTDTIELLDKITSLDIQKNALQEKLAIIISGNTIPELTNTKVNSFFSYKINDDEKNPDIFLYLTRLSHSTEQNNNAINPDIFTVRPLHYEMIDVFRKATGLIEIYEKMLKKKPIFEWNLFKYISKIDTNYLYNFNY